MKRLPIRYLEFILSFKLPKTKGIIKIFQKYTKNADLTNLLKGQHSNAWIFHFLKHTRFLLEEIEQEVIISVKTQDA